MLSNRVLEPSADCILNVLAWTYGGLNIFHFGLWLLSLSLFPFEVISILETFITN